MSAEHLLLHVLADRVRTDVAALRELTPHGVISRAELRRHGWDRDAVARQVRQHRWATHGRQTVALHTGPLPVEAHRWRCVWETGRDIAALDGATALQAAGMTGFAEDRVHVSVVHRATIEPVQGAVVHKVIRRVANEVVPVGVPRTRPAVAAIRAAHWAVSDRQAALLLVMPVQQRIVTGYALLEASKQVRGRTRRAFIRDVSRDIADGAQSLGELDFAALGRQRGLPEPSRQSVRPGPEGHVYLDVEWQDVGLAVEIDGSHHRMGLSVMQDHLRQNHLVLEGRLVLRMDLIGLRLDPGAFMDQVCRAHAAATTRSSR